MVTTIWALVVVGALLPAAVARLHSSMRASARRRSAWRGSRPPLASDGLASLGLGALRGSRAALSTAPDSGSSWPLIATMPLVRGHSFKELSERRAVSLRSRDRSAPTRAIRVRPTAMTWRSYPVWAINVREARASSRLPGSRACSTWPSWRSAVIALRTVRVPPATAAAMTWFLGSAHSRARSTVRAASAGSRWSLLASSQSVLEAEDDCETTPRDSASWTRPTRVQSSWTANASTAAAIPANPSLPVRQSSEGSLASTSVTAVRNPAGPSTAVFSNMCSGYPLNCSSLVCMENAGEGHPVAGVDYPRTYQQLLRWFPDDESCFQYLAGLRWPQGFF